MNKIITNLILLISTSILAHQPIEKQVGYFTAVKVFDQVEVNLIKSDDENKVVITGIDVDDVEIINKKGTLKVRMKFNRIFDGTKTFVEVYYTEIDKMDANEGACH